MVRLFHRLKGPKGNQVLFISGKELYKLFEPAGLIWIQTVLTLMVILKEFVETVGPKLKFLFVSPYPTDPEKRPYSQKFISIFSQDFFLNFNGNLRELSNVNSVIFKNYS